MASTEWFAWWAQYLTRIASQSTRTLDLSHQVLTSVARGQLSGSTITWNAEGNASAPGLTSCAISLTGTAELQTDSIRVPYSGDTCLGKVSGVETLKRR